jgi:hypothetical protein
VTQPTLEVADIFREFGARCRKIHGAFMSFEQVGPILVPNARVTLHEESSASQPQ